MGHLEKKNQGKPLLEWCHQSYLSDDDEGESPSGTDRSIVIGLDGPISIGISIESIGLGPLTGLRGSKGPTVAEVSMPSATADESKTAALNPKNTDIIFSSPHNSENKTKRSWKVGP